MQVEVVELGERPALFTKSRRYAPAAAKAFGEVLGEQEFADIGLVVLDWENEFQAMPDEVARPILHIRVMKRLPEFETHNRLNVDIRFDVDGVFEDDEMTANLIVEFVEELKNKVAEQVAKRRSA